MKHCALATNIGNRSGKPRSEHLLDRARTISATSIGCKFCAKLTPAQASRVNFPHRGTWPARLNPMPECECVPLVHAVTRQTQQPRRDKTPKFFDRTAPRKNEFTFRDREKEKRRSNLPCLPFRKTCRKPSHSHVERTQHKRFKMNDTSDK